MEGNCTYKRFLQQHIAYNATTLKIFFLKYCIHRGTVRFVNKWEYQVQILINKLNEKVYCIQTILIHVVAYKVWVFSAQIRNQGFIICGV